ncbi:MAG: TlyA family RNA methyltransferase [Leptospiraceae bacterium]|nr:TlyA family RNA methyltransferase [Leptospiraceae bacterium]MBK9500386.1 TlyA family RNA methyltransferase [Leptospiraceae bacterium]MBP9165311.1 TlyA family RNA methyltransferase [Leptospiraceae bacterium]
MQKEKIRLDALLVERGLCDDLQRAISLILSGSVIVNGEKITKAGFKYSKDAKLEVLDRIPEYVSRGAFKLKSAFKAFGVNSHGKICIDLGASTGGFTEVLLLGGAETVYAFDVGYGQMASRLQNNNRVKLKDRFNVKNLSWEDLEAKHSYLLVVMDLSFISLLSIFPVIQKLKAESPSTKFEVVNLVKPQFECLPDQTEKGIVKDGRVHWQVLRKITKYLRYEVKAEIKGICNSGIRGASGNREFFIYWEI